jgi:hypothetical protein
MEKAKKEAAPVEKKKRYPLDLTPDQHQQLKTKAAMERTTIKDLILGLIAK